MAGTILRTPALGSADWSGWIIQQERTDRGFLQVSLTNFAVTTASTVATGSVMECAGSIYQFTDTVITLATGAASAEVTVYFVVIPSAGGTTCTIEMSDLEPSWVDAKQGFYASASSVSRVIGGCYIGTSQVYYRKWLYEETALSSLKRYGDGTIEALSAATIGGVLSVSGGIDAGTGGTFLKFKIFEIGDWNMDSLSGVLINHGLTLNKIRMVNVVIRNDADTAYYAFPAGLETGINSDMQGWFSVINATTIDLHRLTAGMFDNVDFDSISYNRGWITIWHEI